MEENNQLPNQETPQVNPEEGLHPGLIALSFCIPLAGAVLYFMNKDKAPKKAQTACYAALAGFGIGLVLNIVMRVMQG